MLLCSFPKMSIAIAGMNKNIAAGCLCPAACGGIFTNTKYFSRREHGL